MLRLMPGGGLEPPTRGFSMCETGFIDIPNEVAKCPECGSQLLVEVLDIDCETNLPWASSVTVQCKNEDFEQEESWHRHWQSEWQPTIDEVKKWLISSKIAIDY